MSAYTPEQAARFWSHVDKSGACWPWTASRRQNGYGQVNIAGRNQSAHRVAWELSTESSIPVGMLIDHACRNRACCNPAHLRLATKKQNAENREAIGSGRSGVRGVAWDRTRNAWAASITHNYRTLNLGRFSTVEEAERVVRAARQQYFTHSDPEGISA
ncbi:MAG: HNH endonuclease [Mycobacteriaceae bacterium]